MMGKRAASRLVMVSGMSEELWREKRRKVQLSHHGCLLLEHEASAVIVLHDGPLWYLGESPHSLSRGFS